MYTYMMYELCSYYDNGFIIRKAAISFISSMAFIMTLRWRWWWQWWCPTTRPRWPRRGWWAEGHLIRSFKLAQSLNAWHLRLLRNITFPIQISYIFGISSKKYVSILLTNFEMISEHTIFFSSYAVFLLAYYRWILKWGVNLEVETNFG